MAAFHFQILSIHQCADLKKAFESSGIDIKLFDIKENKPAASSMVSFHYRNDIKYSFKIFIDSKAMEPYSLHFWPPGKSGFGAEFRQSHITWEKIIELLYYWLKIMGEVQKNYLYIQEPVNIYTDGLNIIHDEELKKFSHDVIMFKPWDKKSGLSQFLMNPLSEAAKEELKHNLSISFNIYSTNILVSDTTLNEQIALLNAKVDNMTILMENHVKKYIDDTENTTPWGVLTAALSFIYDIFGFSLVGFQVALLIIPLLSVLLPLYKKQTSENLID